jgi:hypothetical protein
MVAFDVQTTVEEGLGPLFVVAPQGAFSRVRTPFSYPDGGVVDVFVKTGGDAATVTDLGEALGWLRMQAPASRRSPKQQKLVADVCTTMGVELFKGQLLTRVSDGEDLPRAVYRLGQAAVRVADVWFATRSSIDSVTDEVADLLQERSIAFERAVKLTGRSGRDWTVDFQTHTPEQGALVSVLTSGSRTAARRVSEHVVAAWHDLNLHVTGARPMRFVSLFDDTTDVWADEDFRLVESVSDVCRWSRPDEFQRLLEAA